MYSAVGESYLDEVLELKCVTESQNVVTFSDTMSEPVTVCYEAPQLSIHRRGDDRNLSVVRYHTDDSRC